MKEMLHITDFDHEPTEILGSGFLTLYNNTYLYPLYTGMNNL